jgi:hypothetical protein
MMVRRFFDHTTPDGVTFDERLAERYPHRVRIMGENIWYASGYNIGKLQQVAKEIVDDWMRSPGHRENILDPKFTHLGVGVSARHRTIRATQEFVGRSKPFSFRDLIAQAIKVLRRASSAIGMLTDGGPCPRYTAAIAIFFYRKLKTENRSYHGIQSS